MRKFYNLQSTAHHADETYSGMVPFQKAYLLICECNCSSSNLEFPTDDFLVALIFVILCGNHGLVSNAWSVVSCCTDTSLDSLFCEFWTEAE